MIEILAVFIYSKKGETFSLWSLGFDKAVQSVILPLKAYETSSSRDEKKSAELQTAASNGELMNSIDCATSSNISEHRVPDLQGRVAKGSDCFSS